jgi:hypothetical protein
MVKVRLDGPGKLKTSNGFIKNEPQTCSQTRSSYFHLLRVLPVNVNSKCLKLNSGGAIKKDICVNLHFPFALHYLIISDCIMFVPRKSVSMLHIRKHFTFRLNFGVVIHFRSVLSDGFNFSLFQFNIHPTLHEARMEIDLSSHENSQRIQIFILHKKI